MISIGDRVQILWFGGRYHEETCEIGQVSHRGLFATVTDIIEGKYYLDVCRGHPAGIGFSSLNLRKVCKRAAQNR